MEANIQQLHLRDSQLQGSDGYYAWQCTLDLLRLQQLPSARHAVQRCRAAHKKVCTICWPHTLSLSLYVCVCVCVCVCVRARACVYVCVYVDASARACTHAHASWCAGAG